MSDDVLFSTWMYPDIEPPSAPVETSQQAARAVASKTQRMRKAVWNYIALCGGYGATDDETQIALDMPAHTETPRRWELAKEPYWAILDSGKKRQTRTGGNAIVWVIAEKYEIQPVTERGMK